MSLSAPINYSDVLKSWQDFEKYLIEERYALRRDNKPIESSYTEVIKRVAHWVVSDSTISQVHPSIRKFYTDDVLSKLANSLLDEIVVPASPVLMNAGSTSKHPGFFSCFPLGYVEDSLDEIMETAGTMAHIYKRAGGCGVNVSKIRAKGTPVDNGQGYASGPVSFMQIFDAVAGTISQGGKRRGALMCNLSDSHPDWEEFVFSKGSGKHAFKNMNISLDIEGKIKKEMLDKIADNIHKCGDPGLIFIENAYTNTPIPLELEPRQVNPCVAGDTLLRSPFGDFKIKDLVDQGIKEIPVYCRDPKTGKIHIRMGRNPRKTGINQQIYKVTVHKSRGLRSYVRCNATHNFLTPEGAKIMCKDLKKGTSLMPLRRRLEPGEWILDNVKESHIIAEWKFGKKFEWGNLGHQYTVHHVDGDHLNNHPDNIIVLINSEHVSLHSAGVSNPNYGVKATPEKSGKLKMAWVERGAREGSIHQEKCGICGDLFEYHRRSIQFPKPVVCEKEACITAFYGRREQEAAEAAEKLREHPCPVCNEVTTNKHTCGKSTCIKEANFNYSGVSEDRKKAAEASTRSKAIKLGSSLLFEGHLIDTPSNWDKVYRVGLASFVGKKRISASAILRHFGDWSTFVESAQSYNHKVVSVVEDGIEDVYNITVDEFHTVAWNDVVTANCAEYMSVANTACNLISINLPRLARDNSLDDIGGIGSYYAGVFEAAYQACLFGNILIWQSEGYPVDKIREKTQQLRPVGIGMLGLHGAMIRYGFDYESKAALDFAQKTQAHIALGSMLASAHLRYSAGTSKVSESKRKPDFNASYNPSVPCRVDWMKEHVKKCEVLIGAEYSSPVEFILKCLEEYDSLYNMVTTVQAPTGSISQLVNSASNGIEPLFAIETRRTVVDVNKGKVDVTLAPLEIFDSTGKISVDLKRLGKNVSHNVSPKFQVDIMAVIQDLCHTAISKTINVPEEYTVEEIKQIIQYAFDKKLKAITIFRDSSKSEQVLNRKKEEKKVEIEKPKAKEVPFKRSGETYTLSGTKSAHVTLNYFDGHLREIFIISGRSGTIVNSFCEALGRVISKTLGKHPEMVQDIAGALGGIDAGVAYSVPGHRWRSIPDALSHLLLCKKEDGVVENDSFSMASETSEIQGPKGFFDACPACERLALRRDGGCKKCAECGYSSC